MRPELIRSGNKGFRLSLLPIDPSFNEAGANSLRKYSRIVEIIGGILWLQ